MTLFYGILSATLVVTPIVLVVLALTPFMRRVFAPNGRHVLWLIMSAALLTPFLGFLPAPAVEIAVPVEVVQTQIIQIVQPANISYYAHPPTMSLIEMLFFIWIGG
ncbi:MAG: hypothetical protein FWB98_07400, partial [Defluviitaleaceae bacterium]|nr:hypothetical protein [Defluviitaleaceae bacterium]